MQFLSDDSNEWMRKAAADYPVKPFGMNWEAVAEQLHEEVAPKKSDTGYVLLRYVSLVVFFMLLSLMCNKYLRLDFNKRYNATASADKEPISFDKETIKSNIAGNADRSKVEEKSNKSTRESTLDAFNKNDIQKGSKGYKEFSISQPEPVSELSVSGEKKKDHTVKSINGISAAPVILSETPDPVLPRAMEKENVKPDAVTKEKATKKKGSFTNGRIYAGLLLGPDVSTVKLQKTNGVGYNMGLFLGYKLSAKWHLESGFLLNRKEYYTDGEYFSTDHTYLPSHAYITKVDGYCTMFEIPLNVRYNLTSKTQGNWFATTGLSSYLMNKEDYNYTYKRYNVEYKGNKVYENGSKEWLSVVNASVGYERSIINQKIQFRIEPYLKVPLKGIGTGELPISSAGLNLGVSYPIK